MAAHRRVYLAIHTAILLLFLHTSSSFAEEAYEPFICTSSFPVESSELDVEDRGVSNRPRWGPVSSSNCPPDYAFLHSIYGAVPRSHRDELVYLRGYCCRLPKGVLTQEHEFVGASCSKDFVATGTERPECRNCESKIRCTKINTDKFTLGSPTKGVYVGTGNGRSRHDQTLYRSDLPLALRYVVGRKDQYSFLSQGCVGIPFDSLITEKHSKRCHSLVFRQVLFKDTGKPLELIPKCDRIKDPFSTNPTCIRYEKKKPRRAK